VTRRVRNSVPCRSSRFRHGTTALELVCVLPVLLAIVLGAADLGRFAHYDNIVSNATRLGAEYGATHRRTALNAATWEERVREAVLDELASMPEFDADKLTLNVAMTSPDGQTFEVEVESSYPFEMIVDWPGLPAEFDVRAVVVYEVYR
jgi:Flp pilus assembly protein TadG